MKKIYILFTLIVGIFLISPSFGQENFERRYPAIGLDIISTSLTARGSGNVMLSTQSFADTEKAFLNLAFLSEKGNLSNERRLIYGDSIEIKEVGEIVLLDDGRMALSAVLEKDSLNKVVTYFDGNGNVFWTTLIGQYSDNNNSLPSRSLLLNAPHERILHAHIVDGDANSSDILLTSLAYDGSIFFNKKISLALPNNANVNERLMEMELGIDSTILILGTTDSEEAPMFLTKIDTSGNVLWSKTYSPDFGRDLGPDGFDLEQLLDTTWVVLGSVAPTQRLRNSGILLNLDNEGELLKSESFGASSTRDQIYPNRILGTLDTTLMISVKRWDMVQDDYFPVIFSYDRDSIVGFQTQLDTSTADNLFLSGFTTGDSTAFTLLTTTLSNDNKAPFLGKINEGGNTQCQEFIDIIVFDSINFNSGTIATTTEDLDDIDSIEYLAVPFGLFSPPILTLNDTLFCPDDPIIHIVDATVRGGVAYLWDDNSTDSIRLFREEGMFSVTVTVREDICFTLCDTVTISVAQEPMVTIGKDFSGFCTSGQGILSAEIMGQITDVQWSNGSTEPFLLVDDTPSNYSIEVTDACDLTASASTSVGAADIPQIPLEIEKDNSMACQDGAVTLNALADPSLTSILEWSNGASGVNSIQVTETGQYSVSIEGFCSAEGTTNVADSDIPNIEITLEKNTDALCTDGGVRLFAATNTNPASLVWSTGETGVNSIVVTEAGNYSVVSEGLCPGESNEVTVEELDLDICAECTSSCVIWPNAMQPNLGDPFGATFGPNLVASCTSVLTGYEMRIFNRWGKNIFTSNDPSVRWNGAINGKNQPGGVYFYWSTYQLDGIECGREGDMTLIR